MSKVIRISKLNYNRLKDRAKGFETPNDVLSRILLSDATILTCDICEDEFLEADINVDQHDNVTCPKCVTEG